MRKLFWFVAAAAVLISVDGRAEVTRNIELGGFDPTPSTVGSSFQVQGPDVGRIGDLVLASSMSYAYNLLVLGTVQNPDTVVQHRTMLVLGGSYVFRRRYEAGARMPFLVQSGEPLVPGTTYRESPASGTALGDLVLHGKMHLWRRGEAWSAAAALMIKLPTATDGEFAGTNLPSARALMLGSYVPSKTLTIIANAGVIARAHSQFANIHQRSGLTWGLGVAYRTSQALFIHGEVFGDIVPGGRGYGMESTSWPIEALAGLRYQATRQINVGFALGRGLTAAIGEPDVRGVLTFAFAPSARALPPLQKKPTDVVVIDPNTNDADFDKIVDAADKCPEQREDKDGFQDDDGCPDLDNDSDGVPDDQDKCVAQPEDKDQFEDGDGCPDDDNDKDGIVDTKDKCPREAERINGINDDDGCPDKGESLVISTPDRLELLETVTFNGTNVAKASTTVLAQLATTLRAREDIIRLRIGVHVQPTKNPPHDQALSDKRGAAIRDWLVERGIERERIDPRGFGGTHPLVPATQKGAAGINERVELIILERK